MEDDDLIQIRPSNITMFPLNINEGGLKRIWPTKYNCARRLCVWKLWLDQTIPASFLFYGKTRRRVEVVFSSELRNLAVENIRSVRGMLASGRTPRGISAQTL